MNPRHRDRVAFVRVCSGRLAKDMPVVNARLDTHAAAVARLPLLRPRSRDGARGVSRATSSASSIPGRIAIGDTLYAGKRVAVSADPAVPVRAVRDAAAGRRAAQALRRSDRAAGGRGAAAGVHAASIGHAPSDHRRHRRAAARRRSRRACRRSTASRARSIGCRTSPRAGRSNRRESTSCCRRRACCRPSIGSEREVLVFESDWVMRYTFEKNPKVEFRETM